MEKRSRRRIRDLVAQPASLGLSENEIGCARISMMAKNTNVPFKGRIQKRKTYHLQIITFRLQRAAGPYKSASTDGRLAPCRPAGGPTAILGSRVGERRRQASWNVNRSLSRGSAGSSPSAYRARTPPRSYLGGVLLGPCGVPGGPVVFPGLPLKLCRNLERKRRYVIYLE
jgi:hypothetical protein